MSARDYPGNLDFRQTKNYQEDQAWTYFHHLRGLGLKGLYFKPTEVRGVIDGGEEEDCDAELA